MMNLSTGKKLIFAVIVLLLFFSVIEIGLRLSVGLLNRLTQDSLFDPYERYSPRVDIELIPNYERRNAEGKVILAINSLGFRGPEFSPKKDSGKIRIATAGDSTVFGMYGEDCPYAAQLQKRFTESPEYQNIEVINAGIEGTNSIGLLKRMRHHILPIEPDAIIIAVGWNDLFAYNPLRYGAANTTLQKFWRQSNKLFIFKALRRLIFLVIKPKLSATQLLSAQERMERQKKYESFEPTIYRQNLEEIIELMREKGVAPILLTMSHVLSDPMTEQAKKVAHYPWFTNDHKELMSLVSRYNKTILEIGARYNVPVIDMTAFFENQPQKDRFFTDTMHVFCNGNELIADHLFEEMRKQNLISVYSAQ